MTDAALWDYSVLPKKFIVKIQESLTVILNEVPNVEEIYLFGSCARCTPKWDSDIDIAVVTHVPVTDHIIRGNVLSDLNTPSADGVTADVIFRTQDMHDISPFFLQMFEKDKKLIWRRRQ